MLQTIQLLPCCKINQTLNLLVDSLTMIEFRAYTEDDTFNKTLHWLTRYRIQRKQFLNVKCPWFSETYNLIFFLIFRSLDPAFNASHLLCRFFSVQDTIFQERIVIVASAVNDNSPGLQFQKLCTSKKWTLSHICIRLFLDQNYVQRFYLFPPKRTVPFHSFPDILWRIVIYKGGVRKKFGTI